MTKDMTKGSPLRLILGFAFPMLLGMLFQQFYNLVDTMIVGKTLGVSALAGVGATSSINFMIIGFCMGICSGFAERALEFAETYKNDPVIYTMGSGAAYGAAYMESICIFMEMQWLDSSSIHTGEYFHGPFEITDANRPFMIQISEGSTRPLDERALKFLRTYAKRIEVLDAKELGLSTIDASVVDYFNHSLFNNVYPIYNHALAEKREHPLVTRRYMWKVEY